MAHLKHADYQGAHRLIPEKYSEGSVLETLPLPAQALSDLSELDAATNERKAAEQGRNVAIGPGELLYGVPEARIVNAAFTQPGPFGARFNSPQRGAWYAAAEIETSLHEVVFHRRRFLEDARIPGRQLCAYIDFLADLSGDYHHLEPAEQRTCLEPGPLPQCYAPSQELASALLHAGSLGIVYPSVRRTGGTAIACFRPALVFHPRRGKQYRLALEAGRSDYRLA